MQAMPRLRSSAACAVTRSVQCNRPPANPPASARGGNALEKIAAAEDAVAVGFHAHAVMQVVMHMIVPRGCLTTRLISGKNSVEFTSAQRMSSNASARILAVLDVGQAGLQFRLVRLAAEAAQIQFGGDGFVVVGRGQQLAQLRVAGDCR